MRCDYSHNTLSLISPNLLLSTMLLCYHGWVGTYIPPSYMPLGNGTYVHLGIGDMLAAYHFTTTYLPPLYSYLNPGKISNLACL